MFIKDEIWEDAMHIFMNRVRYRGILKLVPSIVGRVYHCLVLSKQIGCQRMQFCWCQQTFQQL